MFGNAVESSIKSQIRMIRCGRSWMNGGSAALLAYDTTRFKDPHTEDSPERSFRRNAKAFLRQCGLLSAHSRSQRDGLMPYRTTH